MNTKDVIRSLRTQHGLSQDELAEKVFVTRQAVSRWETGETVPNTETLKLLSRLFSVSINTLLGSPQRLICQCCGMPLEDAILGRDADGAINEHYCQWCYADGTYTYSDMDDLIDVCVRNMVSADFTEEQARAEGITDGGCTNCGHNEPCGCEAPAPSAIDSFAHLWHQINGAESWAANPWVWVVEFRRIEEGGARG